MPFAAFEQISRSLVVAFPVAGTASLLELPIQNEHHTRRRVSSTCVTLKSSVRPHQKEPDRHRAIDSRLRTQSLSGKQPPVLRYETAQKIEACQRGQIRNWVSRAPSRSRFARLYRSLHEPPLADYSRRSFRTSNMGYSENPSRGRR